MIRASAGSQNNGAGPASDLLTGLVAQAVKLPAIPASDANVASAYALGWSVGDALMWCEHETSKQLTEVPDIPESSRM